MVFLVAALGVIVAGPVAAAPVCDAVWRDAARGRDVPVRIRMPEGNGRVPVVVFSHGLGGDTGAGAIWGQAWAAHGLAVIHVQHAGSDAAVYRDAAGAEDLRARVRAAATGVQLQARVADVGFVMDRLAVQPREGACDLTRIDRARAGIAGHSMGAWTALAVAGQRYFGAARLADPRFSAGIGFSPSAPAIGSAEEAFGGIAMPFLSVTGTNDGAPLAAAAGVRTAADRQRTAPYRAMPAGGKYLLVFKDGDHMVFSGSNRRQPQGPVAHIQAVAAAATTAFWGATLLDNAEDAAFLSSGLKSRLAQGDVFEAK